MRKILFTLLFVVIASSAYAGVGSKDAERKGKLERKAKAALAEKREENLEIRQQQMGESLQQVNQKLQKLYEQQAITNALLRELIKTTAQGNSQEALGYIDNSR